MIAICFDEEKGTHSNASSKKARAQCYKDWLGQDLVSNKLDYVYYFISL